MTTTVLAYFPSPAQGVWYLGPFPVRAYALCIIAGIIAALVIGDRRWAARGGERGVVYDIALWAVPFGLIGGRLYHVLTDWKTYFGEGGAGLGAALRIWEGGLGIWGAIALGGLGAWIACRRRGIPLPAFGDAVAPGIVLAQAIGRLGNYFNQELYGRETTVPWGMEIFYRRDSSGVVDVHSLDGVSTGQVAAVVHPTFLYELLWNLLVFVFLLYIDRKYRLGHGRLFALYVASYCVGRFWIELMRDDTATLVAGIRINVFTATFVFIGAVVYMLLAPKGREDPATLQGRRDVESAGESAGEESLAEELADDLLAAAKGSGILAAVTVAGEHEAEDADRTVEVDEVVLVEEVEEVEEVVEVEEFVEVVEVEEVEAAVEVEEVVEDEEVVEAEEADDEAATAADAETVVVYADAAETETVVVFDSDEQFTAETSMESEPEPEVELVEPEPEAELVEPEPEAELVEPELEAEPAEPEPEAELAEPKPEPEAELVEPEPEPEPEPVESEPARETAGFGSTMRRLLWGVSSRD